MLVLASRSPRRSELLRSAGLEFEVRPVNVDETPFPDENPEEHVKRLAQQKATAATASADETVLGADTIVVMNGEIFGKPVNAADAERMLRLLSGRKHEVLTGVCLKLGEHVVTDWATTLVWFQQLSDVEIGEYINSGEPLDKAGAYAIQGLASKFIERIDGSYSNVVGLPVSLVYTCLKRLARGEDSPEK